MSQFEKCKQYLLDLGFKLDECECLGETNYIFEKKGSYAIDICDGIITFLNDHGDFDSIGLDLDFLKKKMEIFNKVL